MSVTAPTATGQHYCPTCERMYEAGEHCPEDGTRLVKIKAVVDPLLGRDLDKRYTILEKLGHGGMGAVYRGSQHSVGREVAIKVINPHLMADPDAIKRFLREAKLASKLSHPNAVAVLDFGQTDDGLFYLVMELVSGRTLDQVIKSDRVFRPERIVRIGTQVCDALEGAHALQIVHRDLKPANIMLLTQGRDLVKVLDFGLAKSVATDQAATTMTNAGALLGTPAFMPPELALGQSCDGRADLYALGVILYLLGSGQLPFVSDSPHELIAMHASEPAPPMTGVPPALASVIDRLLRKDPSTRYQTAAETREALEAALDHRVLATPPLGVSIGGDTNPSLGPFIANSDQFANLREAPRRSATEIDRIVSSDTIAAGAPSSAGALQTIREPAPRRRWLVPLLVLGVLATGTGVFVAMSGGSARDTAPATTPATAPGPTAAEAASGAGPATAPSPTTATTTPTAPTTPATTPTPAEAGSGSASGSAAAAVVETTPVTRPDRPKRPPTRPRPPRPDGRGSGAPKGPTMPF